jgi:hypothetical protein
MASGGSQAVNDAMVRRYENYLKRGEAHRDYGHRKVWREGLEVVMKIKVSQGKRRVE